MVWLIMVDRRRRIFGLFVGFTSVLLVASTAVVARDPLTTIAWPRGDRSFEIHGQFGPDQPLSIALHPSRRPVRVTVKPDKVAALCPSTLDGHIIRTAARGWLRSCTLAGVGAVTLLSASGLEHLAFAVTLLHGSNRHLTIRVTYEPADAFVEVITPTFRLLDVTFTPRTRTVGAQTFMLPGYRPVPAAKVTVSQQGRRERQRTGPCDFPSEIDCFDRFRPGREVTASLTFVDDTTKPTALWLSWI